MTRRSKKGRRIAPPALYLFWRHPRA